MICKLLVRFTVLKTLRIFSPLVPVCALAASLLLSTMNQAGAVDSRGNQFFGFKNFSPFTKTSGEKPGEEILTSSEIPAALAFDELVASWNADMPKAASLKIEVRALYNDHATKYYTMGLWSSDPERSPRASVPHQKDDDGDVSTDTLSLTKAAKRFQVRLTLGGTPDARPRPKFLGICVTDTKARPEILEPNRKAWGKTLPVPERSQMAYPNGNVICSPTTVSMLISFWSQELKQPELDRDVPEVVKGVYDTQWKGTGNWPFNTAYAGSLPGMRGCVSRFSDVSELEDWIAKGLPVGMSVDYDRLRAKGPGPNGHLVVCVGFTKEGDPIINDPGTSRNVRKTFLRKNLIYAWSYSHNTVYLIYPEKAKLPKDRFGHWTP